MDSQPSTPTASRPGSRAQSDYSFATEVPDNVSVSQRLRTLPHEIDHIKSLIGRAQGTPRQSESTISAQVFRRRSNSSEPVSKTHILHELDLLKRRIRQEQHTVRRPSEADPETENESESEAEDGVDGAEDELEHVRNELTHERVQREEWLSSAEMRIDILSNEKDGLLQLLNSGKDELSKAQVDREGLRRHLQNAEDTLQDQQKQFDKLRTSLDAARKENKDLQASKRRTEASLEGLHSERDELRQHLQTVQKSLEDEQQQVEDLQDQKLQANLSLSDAKDRHAKLEASLKESEDKVTGLEGNSQVAGEHLQRLVSEHKSKEEESQGRIKDLQKQHENVQEDSERSQAKIAQLEKDIVDHDIRRRELIQQVDEHKKLLSNTKRDVELHGKEITQLLSEHENQASQIEALTKERDDQKTSHEASSAEKEKESSKLKEDHQSLLKSLTDEHEVQQQKLQEQLQKLEGSHTEELETLRTLHSREVTDFQRSGEDEKKQAEEAHSEYKKQLYELADLLTSEQRETHSLHEEMQDREESHKQRVQTFEASMTQMEQTIAASKKRADEAEASLKSQVEQLNGKISTKDHELADTHSQLSELQLKLEEQSSELEDRGNKLSAAADEKARLEDTNKTHETTSLELKEKHLSELETLKDNHNSEVDRLKHEAHDAAEESRASNETKLNEVHSEHEGAIEKLNIKNSAEVERLTGEAKDVADKASASHAAKLEEMYTSHQDALEEVQSDAENRYQAATEQATNQHEEAIQRLQKAETDRQSKARSVHEEELKRSQHQVQSLKDEHELALDKAAGSHKSEIDDLSAKLRGAENRLSEIRIDHERSTDSSEAVISGLRGDLAKATETLDAAKENSTQEMSRLQKKQEDRLRELEAGLSSKAEEAERSHQADLQRAANEATQQTAQLRDDHEKQLTERQADADTRISDLREEHANELAKAQDHHKSQLDEAEGEAENVKNELKKVHEDYKSQLGDAQKAIEAGEHKLANVQEELKSQIDEAQRALEAGKRELQSSKEEHVKALEQLENANNANVTRLKEEHKTNNEASLSEHESALAKVQKTVEGLLSDKSNALTELEESRNALSKSKVTMQQHHNEAIRDALQESQKDHESRVKGLEAKSKAHLEELRQTHERSSRETLTRELDSLKKLHKDDVTSLGEKHDAALTVALANADEELEERLQAQSKAHNKQFDRLQESLQADLESLQLQLEEATELRHKQMQAAEQESNQALTDVGEKLKAAEQTSTALQSRLDIQLTSHAEAERSLAEIRKQRFEEDKKTTESKETLQTQIEALRAEKDTLEKKIESSSNAQQERTLEATETTNVEEVHDEDRPLKRRLTTVEKEREEARASAKQAMNEKFELARQNEFLIKELEAMVVDRSTPATPLVNQTDGFSQTESVVIMSEDDRSRATHEQKSDASLSAVTKQQRQAHGTQSQPAPRLPRLNGGENRAWKTRSFEDYLQQAQAELSELGSVISANEALFAQKIQEHVGDLQRAKDQLATEYKEKFDELHSERERRERDVSVKNAEEFAQERKQLVARYGADYDEPAKQAAAVTNLSTPKRQALRSAEQRLVSEYNRRIVKRKSQIALKHAEDYQSLAQDYDHRIAELLGNRQKLESDLSVEPSKFEQDLDQYETMSVQLETEKVSSVQNTPESRRPSRDVLRNGEAPDSASPAGLSTDTAHRSQLPKRLTSAPRTPTSIPRAVPYPGNRESIDASAQHQKARQSTDPRRSVSERYPPIQPQSLMRIKSPPDVPLPTHTATSPRSSEKSPLQSAKSKFSVEPTVVEHKASPQEKGKLSSPRPLLRPNKGRSLRHSSRIIYGDWTPPNDS